MKPDKAYDFFSAYLEGTLDPSLSAQMERLMDSDPKLRDEFAAFAAAMSDLNGLKETQPEPPADLHERITARVDLAALESGKKQPKGLLWNWKHLAFGGVAALAIIGAALSIQPRGGQSGFGASPAPISGVQSRLHVEASADGAFLRYAPSTNDKVEISRVADGKVENTYEVSAARPLDVPVNNNGEKPIAIRIRSNNGQNEAILVVPGSAATNEATGNGTVLQFAEALASFFRQPVLLESERLDAAVEWSFDRGSATNPKTNLTGLTVALQDRLLLVRF